MVTPPSSPQADADSSEAVAAALADGAATAALPTDPSVEACPRAPLSTDNSSSALPLTTLPPNPAASSSSCGASPALQASVSGVIDFKLALDGTNFQRWCNYINLLLARYHAEGHVREGSANRLADQARRDDDNTVIL